MTAAAGTPPADTHRLEPVGVAFAAPVAALQNACFPEEPWSAGFVASLLEQPGSFAVLAIAGEEPVGFVLARAVGEDAEILALGVVESARRLRLGHRLTRAAIAGAGDRGATALFLEVAEDNNPACNLYGLCGFVAVGRRPGYYRRKDGRVTALVLRYNFATETG